MLYLIFLFENIDFCIFTPKTPLVKENYFLTLWNFTNLKDTSFGKKSCSFEHGLETKNEFEKWPLITFFHCIRDLINDCTAKWTYFAIYWIGLYLRNYNLQFSTLSIPHSDFMPPFYKHCLDLLRTFNELTNNKELKNLTVKDMYLLSSSTHPLHPRIESIHPHLDFVNIWKPFLNKFVDPFSRDVSWRIVHEILPVQHLLCKHKFLKFITVTCVTLL